MIEKPIVSPAACAGVPGWAAWLAVYVVGCGCALSLHSFTQKRAAARNYSR